MRGVRWGTTGKVTSDVDDPRVVLNLLDHESPSARAVSIATKHARIGTLARNIAGTVSM